MDVERKSARHQVVVIGSGFGGLFGSKALKRADVDVTVIARTSHHLFQPLLYQVATGHPQRGRDRAGDARGAGASAQRAGAARRGDRHRPGVAHGDLAGARARDGHAVRLADRGGGLGPVLLRPRRVRRVRPRDEEHRRRAGAARAHLRGVRAGRDRGVQGRGRRLPCSRSSSSGRGRPASRWPARSPSSPTAPSGTTSARSTPGRPASSSSTPPGRCSRRSARSWVPRPRSSWRGSASRCCSARW